MPLLMPDDFTHVEVVAWRVEPAVADPDNPLLEGEMPWDRGGVMTHGTVLKDPIDGLFKAWIVCTPAEEELKEVSTRNHYFRRLCYFESEDGVRWTRPELPHSSFGDYKATNVVFDDTDNGGTQYASVSVDPGKKPWPYEMFVYRNMYGRAEPGHTHLHHYRSRDGKTWELVHGPIEGPFSSDVCFVYPARVLVPDKQDGYVAYYRIGQPDNEAHVPVYESHGSHTRQLFRAESLNGREWTGAEKVIMRDERDHRDTQYMELVPHRVPGGYLAVVSVYHPLTQTLNLRLAASRDGRKWWFPDRRPCLDNAPLGDYGGGMLWQSKNLVTHEDRLYVYYGAMEGLHRPIMDTRGQGFQKIGTDTVLDRPHGFLPFNSALCRASWPTGRHYALVSAAGGPTTGTAVTTPREIGGNALVVDFRTRPPKKSANPDLDEGHLQVELLDVENKPLAGFTRDDCLRLKGDHRAMQVEWTGGQAAPPEAATARFYLKRAFLYGFKFVPSPGRTGEGVVTEVVFTR
jgi:hypothetical protein